MIVPVLLWRLSSGPVVLDFLTPYIEEILAAPDGGVSVRLDTTVLALGANSRTLEIRALGVNAYVGDSARPIASVPEIALTLSGQALLNGQLAPKSITLLRPRLHLVRSADGRLQMDIGAIEAETSAPPTANAVDALLAALVGEPDPSKPGRSLQRAAIIDADLTVDDLYLNTTWQAKDADVELHRVEGGLDGSAHLEFDLGGETGIADGKISYRKDGDTLAAEIEVSGIRPAVLARLGGPLTQLQALDLPLAGMVRAKGDIRGKVDEVAFELAGGAGLFRLPDPVNMQRKVESVSLKGRAFDGLSKARLEELLIDFGGPRLRLAAEAEGLGGASTLFLEASLNDVPFDELPGLWPAIAAPNPRAWVVSNLSKGMVREARATLAARSASGRFDDLVVDSLSGELQGDGVQVDYLHPMPVVKNAAARATFDTSAFRLDVRGGEVYGLSLKAGHIVLSGLDAADQFADIDLTIAGPARDALILIDNKPLRYATALGIDPSTVAGEGVTRLRLKFPLLKNLRLDDLEVKVHSSVKKVFLPKVVMGLDLTQGDLEIDVDAKGLDATGPIVLGSIAGDLKWRENFSTKGVAFRSRYEVKAASISEDQRKLLRLEGPPFVAPFMTGPVAANVVATLYGGGRGDIEAKVDLSPAFMRLPGLGWYKRDGTTGGADVSVRLVNNEIAAIPRFSVVAGDLQTRGAVAFSDGRPRRVEFERLRYGGRTDVAGTLTLRPNGGLDIVARGDQFNAEPVVGEEAPIPGDPPLPAGLDKHRKKADLPPMTIQGSVKTAWLSKDGKLADASAHLQRDSQEWRQMQVKGKVGDGKTFDFDLRQSGPNRRAVKVTSDDAGAVLKAFDSYQHMVSGKLEVNAAYEDDKDGQPLVGTIKVADYYIVNAPALARLLTVAALSGILDVLQDQGVGFSTLDAPFVLKDGLLTLNEARAYGAALGLTAKGELDLDAGRMALEGTVVPAYALNSVLGNIPVLGWLVTGGEKGGGLVAFNYSMRGPTQDPDVMVNPLSALTPGFLRNLFNIFDDGSETEARKRAPEKPVEKPAEKPVEAPPLRQ
ncbi:MAG: hypothetical protein FD176_1756 [Rhodospirillaceae bacterium]|nr:MAG: hypothetical protein FD176_1756 [Rhodospirillaceae bacterium]TNC96257.1 MAG: hypothetical protein FD119_1857 [Stygiobacter sp.]